jgi:hypothetical protein
MAELRFRALARRLAFVSALVAAAGVAAEPPDETELEFLWQVNLARNDPAAWARENGLGALLDGIAPRPPLSWNATLLASAQAKAQEFVDHGYFGHDSPVTGSPNSLIVNVFGYPLAANSGFYFGPDCQPCVYGSFGNTGVESLASSFGPTGGNLTTPRAAVWALLGEICDVAGTPNSCGTNGHRNHLLGAAALTAPMVESGAGHVVRIQPGPPETTTHFWVFHTGFPAGNEASMPQFLTGVAYADADGDGRYDAGEGLGGVTVEANALSATTNAEGDWSLAVDNGSYDVRCSGGPFAGTATAADVMVADANREVDCRSGVAQAIVDFAPEPGAPLARLAACAALAVLARRARRLTTPAARGKT